MTPQRGDEQEGDYFDFVQPYRFDFVQPYRVLLRNDRPSAFATSRIVIPAWCNSYALAFSSAVQRFHLVPVCRRRCSGWGNDGEVLGAVVELLPVPVVNDFVPRELPTLALFNDVQVLGDLLAIDVDVAVAALDPALAANDSPVVASYHFR